MAEFSQSDLARISHLGSGTRDISVLNSGDIAGLVVVEDNTDMVIEQLSLAIARALEAIGIEAEGDAASITPVDTGRLKNSITHTIDADGPWAVIGTNVEYAKWVHMGARGRDPQPFLTDAVTHNAEKYRKMAEAALKNA